MPSNEPELQPASVSRRGSDMSEVEKLLAVADEKGDGGNSGGEGSEEGGGGGNRGSQLSVLAESKSTLSRNSARSTKSTSSKSSKESISKGKAKAKDVDSELLGVTAGVAGDVPGKRRAPCFGLFLFFLSFSPRKNGLKRQEV